MKLKSYMAKKLRKSSTGKLLLKVNGRSVDRLMIWQLVAVFRSSDLTVNDFTISNDLKQRQCCSYENNPVIKK